MVALLGFMKLAALAFASYESIRARFWPGIGAIVTMAYLTAARLASVLPPHPQLPLRRALEETWWIYPCALVALSIGPMMFAFLKQRALHEDDDRHKKLERVAFAFLANVLLDVAVLVIVVASLLAVARTA